MIVNDIIWGKIEIEPEYLAIIKSKEFNDTKNKSQLGLNVSPNATHARYHHLLGTYHVSSKLIDICKKNFSKVLNITASDEKAIKCMALVHDIGHACFSHSSEHYLDGSHEENTVKILLDSESEIHQAIVSSLGEEVLEKVVDLIEMKAKIKGRIAIDNTNNLMLVIGKLLSGGIDVDRIDYIARDSKYLTGSNNDFSDILEGIGISYIGDSLEIVFDENVEYKVANFFNKRFELYDCNYFGAFTRLIETIYGRFIELSGINLTWDTTEIEMRENFRKYLNCDNEVLQRYAYLLHYRVIDSSIIVREINDKAKFDFFQSKVHNAVPELANYPECIYTSDSFISTYSKKNKIYINKGGIIQDISDSSKILNSELTKGKYAMGIDVLLLKRLLVRDNVPQDKIDSIIKKVQKAMSNEIEQEKKYTFNNLSTDPKTDFKRIRDGLGLIKPKFVTNYDTYYEDSEGILKKLKINIRKRVKENGEYEWTVKRPVKDQTSISKRDEKDFTSLEEAISFLRIEWNIVISDLKEECTAKTLRAKYKLEYCGGVFEVAFDKTTPIYGTSSYIPNYMIECELKSGDSSGLYFLNEYLKKYEFLEECNLSKKEIAVNTIQTTEPLNSKDEENIDSYKTALNV